MCRKKIASLAIFGVVAIAAMLFFLFCYPYHFFHREQFSLFLTSEEFVRQMFSQGVYCGRAWLPTIVGGYLSQFYYYVGGGPVIVSIVLWLMGLAVWHALRKLGCDWRLAVGIAVVVMIWEAGRQSVGEYPLASSLSLLIGVGLASAYPVGRSEGWRFASAVVACAMCVTSIGYGGIVAVAYVAVAEGLRRSWLLAAMGVVAAIFVPHEKFVGGCWIGMPDMTVERVLKIDVKTFWEKEIAKEEFTPEVRNNQIANCLYTLSQIKKEGDAALDGIDWSCTQLFIPVDETGNYMTITAAGEVWYAIGDMTMAEHATILGMIFSPWHSGARHIMRMAELNIIKGDEPAAAKYLQMLSHNIAHAKWADARKKGHRTAAYVGKLKSRQAYAPASDTLRVTSDYVRSLRNLLNSNPQNDVARTYLLALDMQRRSMADFAEDYIRYGHGIMTRSYAEALMVVGATAPADVKQRLSDVDIPMDVVRDFGRFNKLMANKDIESLRREYRGSYWWYCQTGK